MRTAFSPCPVVAASSSSLLRCSSSWSSASAHKGLWPPPGTELRTGIVFGHGGGQELRLNFARPKKVAGKMPVLRSSVRQRQAERDADKFGKDAEQSVKTIVNYALQHLGVPTAK